MTTGRKAVVVLYTREELPTLQVSYRNDDIVRALQKLMLSAVFKG